MKPISKDQAQTKTRKLINLLLIFRYNLIFQYNLSFNIKKLNYIEKLMELFGNLDRI